MANITTRTTAGSVAGAGNITTFTNSAAVVGVSTTFTTTVKVGQALYTTGSVYIGTVHSITNATNLTLTTNAAVAGTNIGYNIVSVGVTNKVAPLTNIEIDANFLNINNDKISVGDAVSTNTPGAPVRRDPSGNFSANQITTNAIVNGVTIPTTNVSQAQMEAGTDTSTRYMTAQNVRQAIEYIGYQGVASVTGDLHGFVSKSTSTLLFNSSTRVLTLTPISTTDVWYKGRKYNIPSALTYTVPASAFNQYIRLNVNTMALEATATFDLYNDIYVAYIYWDAVNARAVVVGDERHTAARDTQWHYSKHTEQGAVWKSGGVASYTLNNQGAIGMGFTTPIVLADEDLEHTISHSAAPGGYYQEILNGTASIPTLYLNGTNYVTTTSSTVPWVAGTATARYNPISAGNGSLADTGEGRYVNYWIVCTNDILLPVKAIMGRQTHATVMDACQERFSEYGLPFAEMAPMYQVTLRTSTSYTSNTPRVQIAMVRKIFGHQTAFSDLNGVSHTGLSDLFADDHLQYVHVSTARTITAAHTFSGVQTFQNGIKINVKPTVNLDGANKQYVDTQALLMSFLNA